MDRGTLLWVSAMLSLALLIQLVSLAFQLRELWSARRGGRTPWNHCELRPCSVDRGMHDLSWRRIGDRIEVEYVVENRRPGRLVCRNDLIQAFQRGVSLEETGEDVEVTLLRGAVVTLSQTFRVRDGSTPVFQISQRETIPGKGGNDE